MNVKVPWVNPLEERGRQAIELFNSSAYHFIPPVSFSMRASFSTAHQVLCSQALEPGNLSLDFSSITCWLGDLQHLTSLGFHFFIYKMETGIASA